MSQFDYSAHRIGKIRAQIMQELEELKELPHYYHPDMQKYVAYLRARVKLDQKESNAKYRAASSTSAINTDLELHRKKLERRIYQVEWKKLKEYHKVLQVRKFVAALKYPTSGVTLEQIAENREMVEKTIVLGLTTSRFVKKKSTIHYNELEMRITSISCLELDDDLGLYVVNWDK